MYMTMRTILTALLVCVICLSAQAQRPAPDDAAPVAAQTTGRFTKYDYQGYSFMIPAESLVRATDTEAVIRTPDGTFGMSVKVERDRKAAPGAAVELCRRMVRELDVKGAKVTRVLVHGLQGAKLEGVTEGLPITVLILAHEGRYVKMVLINIPQQAATVNIVTDSVTRTE